MLIWIACLDYLGPSRNLADGLRPNPSEFAPCTPWCPQERSRGRVGSRGRLDRAAMSKLLQEGRETCAKIGRLYRMARTAALLQWKTELGPRAPEEWL